MAGYSGTPLPKKLGFKPGYRFLFDQPPEGWREMLGELPERCAPAGEDAPVDLAILFALRAQSVPERFAAIAGRIAPAGMIWIAWPKKAAGYATDLDDNVVRQIGLDAGLVDIKVCAIDDFWSGLKFVKRIKSR